MKKQIQPVVKVTTDSIRENEESGVDDSRAGDIVQDEEYRHTETVYLEELKYEEEST